MAEQANAAAQDDEDGVFAKRDDVDEDDLLEVLGEAVEAIEDAGVPYAFIGGLASILLGPPSSTTDIDFFVRPEDAPRVLEILEQRGFETKIQDPSWLMKAAKNRVLVDVIFRSTGDVYLDEEMIARTTVGEFKRQRLRIVSAEDLMVMKALAQSRDTKYWYDALDLLAHAEMDWDYVLRRARHGPRRVLSLLIYAQSEDLAVPNGVIAKLFDSVYGG
jgi:predicted nucleotidyltransferase